MVSWALITVERSFNGELRLATMLLLSPDQPLRRLSFCNYREKKSKERDKKKC
ncbi:hypothetical protein Bca4012_077273 [Brassica carinata]